MEKYLVYTLSILMFIIDWKLKLTTYAAAGTN